MSNRKGIPDELYLTQIPEIGITAFAKKHGLNIRAVSARRRVLERKYKTAITPPDARAKPVAVYPGRIGVDVKDGHVLIGSDAHYWPEEPTTAHRAFVKMAKELKPKVVIQNGDVMDFPRISRHAPIGWSSTPEVQDEIENAQDRMHEIEVAAGKAKKIWTLGNHDARFETRLATVSSEYVGVHGTHLYDHFPLWEPCWSCWINDDVVVKHRFKGGIHATHNNVLWAGKTTITGHLHSLQVRPFTDYNGTKYGVDTGCLADPAAKAFLDYTEDGPKNWRSGFILLTFVGGKLLWPEIVSVSHLKADHIEFRGQLIRV